jgi:hypothetical protein
LTSLNGDDGLTLTSHPFLSENADAYGMNYVDWPEMKDYVKTLLNVVATKEVMKPPGGQV